jgi:hypothetical protein
MLTWADRDGNPLPLSSGLIEEVKEVAAGGAQPPRPRRRRAQPAAPRRERVGSMPSDFHIALGLYTSTGAPVRAVRDTRRFYDSYNANLSNGTGTPEAFTVVGSQLLVGPAGDGSSGVLVYEKSKPTLVNDSDTTGLPDGYDLALVHGGKAEGFKLSNIPLWQGFDEDFTAASNALQRNYLTGVRGQVGQFGAFRPGTRQWR